MSLCINCGIATDRCNTIGSRQLEDDTVLSIVRKWVAPKPVNPNDIICQSCYKHANSQAADEVKREEAPLGHRRVCTLCGRSLLRRVRCHELNYGSEQNCRVIEVIKEWILPRTMSAPSFLCHSCWVRATKKSRHFPSDPLSTSTMPVSEPSSPGSDTQEYPSVDEDQVPSFQEQPASTQMSNTIVLPDYFRAADTESRCFVEGCLGTERNRVPLSTRQQLLKMYNYYVPPSNRLCNEHLTLTSWDFLNDIANKKINVFNAEQIQDMLSLKDCECDTF